MIGQPCTIISVIMVGTSCIPFFKVDRNGGRGRIKKDLVALTNSIKG